MHHKNENNDLLTPFYEEKELKPYVPAKKLSEEDLIKKIPAEALKKYILSDKGLANTDFDMDDLEKTFIEYVPKQEYDYYYNNLYNCYLLKDEFFELYDSYFDEIRTYIDASDYLQAFNVIKSIIEVSHDLDIDIVPDLPELGMYFRIAYRKASKEIKKEIEKYVMSLIFHQYYNNCYLIPLTTGSSDSTYTCDYYYYSSRLCGLSVGGGFSDGSGAGLFYWFGGYALGYTVSDLGGRAVLVDNE